MATLVTLCRGEEEVARMSLTFEGAVQRLESKLGQVVPVRITAHGEDGTVLYGYGGLLYQPPAPRFVYVTADDFMLSQADSYVFEGGRLTTEGQLTNARVRLLNNLAYDGSKPDGWDPPTYQSFLITRFDPASIQIGWASKQGDPTHRRLILRVTRGSWAQLSVVDIELDQRDDLLTGLGALSSASVAAIWTVSFLDPIPYRGNEIG
jgi:hypothetical protein